MRVSGSGDHIDQLSIGTKEQQSFGMSDSAEFFNLITSSLYRRPLPSMVQEIICNAWDAHINAGITHKSIIVDMEDDCFVVKDFGKGIPVELMHETYCVLGKSTKVDDSSSTGGFGLGCKAPFAYTDEFTVINCNNGYKYIYSLTRSSIEDGKPSINLIAKVPTKETGMAVKVPVLDKFDRINVIAYAIQTIAEGAIHAKNNLEVKYNRLEYGDTDFTLVKIGHREKIYTNLANRIHVKYGNVLYEINPDDSYKDSYKEIKSIINRLNNTFIVFHAKPNTLSILPSREGLVYSDNTIETIKELIENFVGEHNKTKEKNYYKLYSRRINEYIRNKEYSKLFSINEFTNNHTDSHVIVNNLLDVHRLQIQYLSVRFTEDFKKLYLPKLQILENHNLISKLLHNKIVDGNREHCYNEFFKTIIDNKDKISLQNLYLIHKISDLIPFSEIHLDSKSYIGLSQKVLVLCTSKSKVEERYTHYIDSNNLYKKYRTSNLYLFYKIRGKREIVEKYKTLFISLGFDVVDLTQKQEWEVTTVVKPKAGKKLSGLVKFSNIITQYNTRCTTMCAKNSVEYFPLQSSYIEKPKFIVSIGITNLFSSNGLPYVFKNIYLLKTFVELHGEEGGIATNSRTYNKYIDMNIPNLQDYFNSYTDNVYLKNKNIVNYLKNYNFDKDVVGLFGSRILNFITRNELACKYFKFKYIKCSDEELKIIELILRLYTGVNLPKRSITTQSNKNFIEFSKKLADNSNRHLIDHSNFMFALGKAKDTEVIPLLKIIKLSMNYRG